MKAYLTNTIRALWLGALLAVAGPGHAQLDTQETLVFLHTDALGSALLETDINGDPLREVDYRAYGEEVLNSAQTGPGYTGHYRDASTGLVYMQQRYYDPQIGRFLSVDPVAADVSTGGNFNRYKYAANSPYSFKDPDGRQECRSCEISYGAAVGYMLRDNPDRYRIWLGGEQAATFSGTGAEDGAAVGQAIGAFVDTGNYSPEAIASVTATVAVGVATRGKSTGPMHGPSPLVHAGQQGKHQLGHNNFSAGRSILSADPYELGRYAGTGQKIGKIDVGLPGSKERVDFGREIGTFVDEKGHSAPTNMGIIHYGKNGMHIVPSRPVK